MTRIKEEYTSRERDKFYTLPEASEGFIEDIKGIVRLGYYDNIIEPSAGSGALLRLLPSGSIGIDIDPEAKGIVKCDFFDYEFPVGKTIIIGNPPFGKSSKLAIEFFNRCAEYADVICFIVPCTWNKFSIQRRLDERFHLILSEKLPEESFTLNGKPHRVRCSKQIWIRGDLNNSDYEGYTDYAKSKER